MNENKNKYCSDYAVPIVESGLKTLHRMTHVFREYSNVICMFIFQNFI